MGYVEQPRPEDLVSDDDNLLQDRLLRSLHRNSDGHLGGSQKDHKVSKQHNAAVLYLYTLDDDLYCLDTRYVYSDTPLTYKGWLQLVLVEAEAITAKAGRNFYGFYGWSTTFIKITPLRTGDLWIKIDAEGCRCVRLSFNTRKGKRKAQHEAKQTRR